MGHGDEVWCAGVHPRHVLVQQSKPDLYRKETKERAEKDIWMALHGLPLDL